MTPKDLTKLRGLIYESEMAAQLYGAQMQRLNMLSPTNDTVLLQSRKNIELEYAKKWGDASKALHEFIESLVVS